MIRKKAEHAKEHVASNRSDPRWRSVMERDAAADGTFFYSVTTTGVYCQPSCASRRPRVENVRFFASTAEAEAAGFRACKRCNPKAGSPREQHAAMIEVACRRLEDIEQDEPTLQELSELVGMSPFHLHRTFRAMMGVTPKSYAAAQKRNNVRHKLKRSSTVTEAIYQAGFNSNSRFYGNSDGMLGMTPSAFRRGGVKTEITFAVGQCALGAVLVAQSERGICAISLGDDPEELVHELENQFPTAVLRTGDSSFDALVASVVALVEFPAVACELPLDIHGTAFQQRVWEALRKLPAGHTSTYADIAKQIGAPQAVRAVAQAIASNKLAVAIPCHRVIRSDGSLSGYRWGVERKKQLLDKEQLPSAS